MGKLKKQAKTRSIALRAEAFLHRLTLLGMASAAIEDLEQRNAFEGFAAEAQNILSGIVKDLNRIIASGESADITRLDHRKTKLQGALGASAE